MTYIFSLRPTQSFSPGPVYEIPIAGFTADWLQLFLTTSVNNHDVLYSHLVRRSLPKVALSILGSR